MKKLALVALLAILTTGCASTAQLKTCQNVVNVPVRTTAYVPGVGGIVDAVVNPTICLDK